MTRPNFSYWRFEYRYTDGQWKTLTHYGHRPGTADNVRNIRPLYEHPAPPQPATDSSVEAARRTAVRHILVRLAEVEGFSHDRESLSIKVGVLRDLVGRPTPNPPEPDLKVSATMPETRVNTADLAQKDAAPPARLSVDMLAAVIANSGSYTGNPNNRFIQKAAHAVHKAIYGQDA